MDIMKKRIALLLVLALIFALCACGQPQVIEKEVEKTVEVPVIPEAWQKYQKLFDALKAEDYDGASEIFEGLLPEPEGPPTVKVEITKDNFLDYFEFQQFPPNNLDFGRTSAGEITSVFGRSGFYLKEGYRVAHEMANDCKVEVGVKYKVSWFYNGNKGINVYPATCTYDITLKPNDVSDEDELIEGVFWIYPDGYEEYAVFFKYGAQLSKEKNRSTLIIEPDGVELVSATGTLYLYE